MDIVIYVHFCYYYNVDMQSLKYFDKVKTGNETHEILSIPECKICEAENSDGKSMRAAIDKYAITHGYRDTLRYAQMYSMKKITLQALKKHLDRHSKYIATVKEHIKDLAEQTAMEHLDQMDERADPDEVISEIITIGGQKIKTGEMPVDGKLLLGALKEQGARRKFGTLRDVLEGLDRVRFGELPLKEGEVVEDAAPTSETPPNLQG